MTTGTDPGAPGFVWSVGMLIAAVAEIVQAGFSSCSVRGEVSGVSRAASGHCYFNLKDAAGGATLRCAMFRRAAQLSAFLPADGDAIEARGRLAVYEQRGELQLVVEAVRRAGAGALYERFLRLKAELEADGLFDPLTRRPLPAHPATVGIVTSLGGAALHDVATTLARRSPHVSVIVYPSLVQGADAPAALCQAIAVAGRRREVDVLVVCRGGGSLEDLWAFNDERVVRALKASPIPVLCGIGHETDVTLADLAADLRAPTPTAAAELVAAAAAEAGAKVDALAAAMQRRLATAIDREAQRLDRAALRLAAPGDTLDRRRDALSLVQQRLGASAQRFSAASAARLAAVPPRLAAALSLQRQRRASRLEAASLRLDAVDPHRVLGRGYALLADARGHPITRVAALGKGDRIHATLVDGTAKLRVDGTTIDAGDTLF